MKQMLLLALRNIQKRKRRAALTMLGIFMGIAAVVALVALGQGLQDSINAQFEKIGADKIIVQPKDLGFGANTVPGALKKHDLELIKRVHGVTNAAGMLFRAVNVQFNNVQRAVHVMSIPQTQKEVDLTNAVHTFEVSDGRLLSYKDKQKVVIGNTIAHKKTFKKDIRVGNKIVVNKELFEVVGILKRIGDPQMDNGLVMPEQDVRSILNELEVYSMITAQSAQGIDPDVVARRIESVVRKDRHEKEGKEDFSVQTSTELIASFNKVLNIIQAVFIGIAAISLVVGGVGIMNTMYTSVLERTREIGVMKAIGARNRDVLQLFLIESGLLGAVGGCIGMTIGVGMSKTVELVANTLFGAGTLHTSFSFIVLVGVVTFSCALGALSGVFPARKAAHLKPVEALRYE